MSLAERLAKAERPDRIDEVRVRIQERLVEVLGRSVIEAGGCIDIHTDRAVGPAARPCALGPLVA